MPNIYCYMFEAKSIQSYIFRTGKLRDVIAASERLEQLIDTDDNSILTRILNESTLKIDFVRRKGGAFYAYSNNEKDLISLRKIWSLTVQQLFPSLDFIDGIDSDTAQKPGLISSMSNTQLKIAASRNNPNIKVPLYRANMQLSARTAKPALSYDQLLKEYIDIDTNINRHVYKMMRDNNYEQLLYKKFIDSELSPFPLNLEPVKPPEKEDFPYIDNKHDLALIHIDGNGIGLLLRGLIKELRNKNDKQYAEIFLEFSNILANSTQEAAKSATEKLRSTLIDNEKPTEILPMRPLIMGGDDITLFCRADLAVDYAMDFCLAFQSITAEKLKILYEIYELKGLPNRLTASGGIIFQKATQPFTVSHHIVEELCKKAKILTKQNLDKNNIGPPALSFIRIATAQDDNYKRLFNESHHVKTPEAMISTSIGTYLVTDKDPEQDLSPNLNDLNTLVNLVVAEDSPLSTNKLRQILAEIHKQNLSEAQSLANRVEQRKVSELTTIKNLFSKFTKDNSDCWWMWDVGENKQTILSDILTLAKFKGDAS